MKTNAVNRKIFFHETSACFYINFEKTGKKCKPLESKLQKLEPDSLRNKHIMSEAGIRLKIHKKRV